MEVHVCVIGWLYLWEHESDFTTKNQVCSSFWVSWCDHDTRNLSYVFQMQNKLPVCRFVVAEEVFSALILKCLPHQYILRQQNMLGWNQSVGNSGFILLKLAVQQSSVPHTGHLWISQVPLCTEIIKILTENTVKGNMAHWPHTMALLSNSYLWTILWEPLTEPV